MEIAKYNDMMAYLTRKDPGPRAKPQELLDIQEKNRQQRIKESLDKIGPSMEPESKEFIERENLAEGGVKSMARGAGKIALGELAFAPVSIVLDTYAGLTPQEMVLNIATFGLGSPMRDSIRKRKFINELGLSKDYQSALSKKRILKTAPEESIDQLTEKEKQAIFASNVFDEELKSMRSKQAEEYKKQFKGQLKRGELEIKGEETVPERDSRVEPEFVKSYDKSKKTD